MAVFQLAYADGITPSSGYSGSSGDSFETQTNVGSGSGYEVWIDSKFSPDAESKGKRYYISSGMKDVGDNDARFQEFAGYVERALSLSKKRYARVASSEEADIIIRIGYSVSKAEKISGGVISWKTLIVGAYDLKGQNQPELWRVNLITKGGWVQPGNDGLRDTALYLAVAGVSYFGVPSKLPAGTPEFLTGDKKSIIIFKNDPRVEYIKTGSQAQGPVENSAVPAVSPALPANEVSNWPGIDVKIRKTNLFTAYHTIVSIVAGSPASRAGLMVGDHIFKIDSHDASRMTTEQLMERMREAGSQMTLTIRRKGQDYTEAFPVVVTRAGAASAKDREAPIAAMIAAAPAAPVNNSSPSAAGNLTPTTPATPVPAAAKSSDKFVGRVFWGLVSAKDTPAGPVATGVQLEGAMYKAGVKDGDIFVSVNGSPIKTQADMLVEFKASRPYTPVNIVILRSGNRLEKTFLPTGGIKLELKEVNKSFTIPGVPPAAAKPASALDELDNINVLKKVIIDQVTGQIALVGSYDPMYATGPIDYLDLLKTALKYPEPELSLLTADTVQAVEKYDPNHYHLPSIALAILGMPAAEQERQLLIPKLAEEFGITPQEYADLYNFAYIYNYPAVLAPPEVSKIIIKVFRHAGHDNAATAYEKLSGKTAESYAQALKILGWEAEAARVLSDTATDKKQKEDKFLVLAAAAIMVKTCKTAITPDNAAKLKSWAETGEMNVQSALEQMYQSIPIYTDDSRGRRLAQEAVSRIPIGDAPTRALCGIDASPVLVRIETEGVEPNSALARILYEADYAGKTFILRPELFDKIPGQVTSSEYLTRKMKGTKIDGSTIIDASFWFEPKRVEMRVSPDKKTVSFGVSEIRFTTNMDEMKGSSKEGLQRLLTLYDDWCAQYTDKYEEYCRIIPAFHKLRESAKAVALARWLNSERITVNLDNVVQERWDRPATITGFWRYSVFSSEESPGVFKYPVVNGITGGVSFKPKQAWTAVEVSTSESGLSDQLKLSNQLGEKAVDAAMTGTIEEARYLAELSAKALTGEISRQDLIKLKVSVAEPVELPESPQAVLLQKEMIKKTYDQIVSIQENPASRSQSEATLDQIKNLYSQVRQDPAKTSDHLQKIQAGPLSVPPAPAAKPVPATTPVPAVDSDELKLRQELLGSLADTIRKRTAGTNSAAQGIISSLKTNKPPELESQSKNMDELAPGDVILVSRVYLKDWQKSGASDILISNAVSLIDKWSSNCWSSPASHAAVFLGERGGKRWYMDNTSEHGPVIKEEGQFMKEYGAREMNVATVAAEPISEAEAEIIFKAAHELRDAGIKYGILSEKRMVCSDAARWLLMQAGRDIPRTEGDPGYPNLITVFVQKKDLVSYSPADFYGNREYFIVRPLNTNKK